MKNNRKIIIAILSICFFTETIDAKVRSVTTRRDLELTLSKTPIVVVLFYKNQKKDMQMRDRNKGLIRMYEDLSSYKPYDEADLAFLKVNIERKDLADCANLYGIMTVPTIAFFKNGKRLINEQGAAIDLKGFISRIDLQAFIDKHYGTQIKEYVIEKENRRQRAIESGNESWKPYFYPRDMVVRGYAPEETFSNRE